MTRDFFDPATRTTKRRFMIAILQPMIEDTNRETGETVLFTVSREVAQAALHRLARVKPATLMEPSFHLTVY
jgi:hypothetical protein